MGQNIARVRVIEEVALHGLVDSTNSIAPSTFGRVRGEYVVVRFDRLYGDPLRLLQFRKESFKFACPVPACVEESERARVGTARPHTEQTVGYTTPSSPSPRRSPAYVFSVGERSRLGCCSARPRAEQKRARAHQTLNGFGAPSGPRGRGPLRPRRARSPSQMHRYGEARTIPPR